MYHTAIEVIKAPPRRISHMSKRRQKKALVKLLRPMIEEQLNERSKLEILKIISKQGYGLSASIAVTFKPAIPVKHITVNCRISK